MRSSDATPKWPASSASLLLSVINDILDFSKIEAGKLDFERLDFNFDEVIQEVRQHSDSGRRREGLELTCRSSSAIPARWSAIRLASARFSSTWCTTPSSSRGWAR